MEPTPQEASFIFQQTRQRITPTESSDFPGAEYDENPVLPFEISFLSSRTIRLRFLTRHIEFENGASLMLARAPFRDGSWQSKHENDAVTFHGHDGRVKISKNPWSIEIYNSADQLLTRTMRLGDTNSFAQPIPFSFIRRARDLGRTHQYSRQFPAFSRRKDFWLRRVIYTVR
jgi:alpha-D-xyloside xylohydrolase